MNTQDRSYRSYRSYDTYRGMSNATFNDKYKKLKAATAGKKIAALIQTLLSIANSLSSHLGLPNPPHLPPFILLSALTSQHPTETAKWPDC